MRLIYYAHSYRPIDAQVVEFFAGLMRSEGFTPSLDPPSDQLNSAKPERHLRSTDGMIVVLTARANGVSRYILYEATLAVRSDKPLLVFVEDTLPDKLVPERILQRRFNRRSLLREVRQHRQALRTLATYLGETPPPQYQPTTSRRRCLLVGLNALPSASRSCLPDLISSCEYDAHVLDSTGADMVYDASYQESISTATMAVCVVDGPSPQDQFLFGALRSSLVPTILLTTNPSYRYHETVPREYQARLVTPSDPSAIALIATTEIKVLEEEYVDLDNQAEVLKYHQMLVELSSLSGSYGPGIRDMYVNELTLNKEILVNGDNVEINNTGGVLNYRSSLAGATQTIGSSLLPREEKDELGKLFAELQRVLQSVAADNAAAVDRVVQASEMIASELAKPERSQGFLRVTTEGLKEAAKALEGIAPTAIGIAMKIAALVTS